MLDVNHAKRCQDESQAAGTVVANPPAVAGSRIRVPKGRLTRKLIAFSLQMTRKLLRRGWSDSAIGILQKIVDFEPNLFITRICLARVALSIGDDATAVNAIRPEVIDNLPDIRFHYCRIAKIYIALEDFAAAEKYLQLATLSSPLSPRGWRLLGELDHLRGHIDESVSNYQRAADFESTLRMQILDLQNAAASLADAGRKDAEHLYQEILELNPNHPFAYYGIVDCRRGLQPGDPILEIILRMVTDPSVKPAQKAHLHYALGNIYDGWDNAAGAFAHWMIANRLRSLNAPKFDLERKKARADARCRFFTREKIEELSQYGCQEDVLICVVGMPRSGTTLTEQIIGSHSQAYPMGERNDFFRLASTLPKALKTKSDYPDCCSKLTAGQITQTWRTILDRMRRTAGPCHRMVTKLPEDYFELGLIKILFPKAHIINTRRNLLDVGLSCFRQNFKHIPYSRSMEDLAEAFKIYQQMMNHWRSVLSPSSIYDVTYEHLVADPERIVRELCKFLDLPFETSCLEFHSRNQPIKTCSRWQVRQPIYQTSVNRSDAYREFLGPLLEFAETTPAVPAEDSAKPNSASASARNTRA